MITAEQLEEYGWYCDVNNKTIWFYDSWEYEYRINSQELYNINDGIGGPEFITKVTEIDELCQIYNSLELNNLWYKPMKNIF